jgi:CPA1 family monovalent cation:H+ antiporter
MLIFETLLALLLGATLLSAFSKRVRIPYPALLALGGAAIALIPGVPKLDLPAELILALFVAPVLLDAAHDTSLRDLRINIRPVLSLVLVAVGLTTAAVAVAARILFPEMPWAAAVALGALLAPPDVVAALAVLREVEPPHRIRKVLEGESLLNDASALLLYKFAVGAVAVGSFSLAEALPAFPLVLAGSVALGWLLARLVGLMVRGIDDAPTAVILQFVVTFGVWLLAEHLHLSAVITIVTFGLTAAQRAPMPLSARLRVSSFAIWETVTFVLKVLAFTLIGLQLRPILETQSGAELARMLVGSLFILAVVIIVRLVWVMINTLLEWRREKTSPDSALNAKEGLVIGWSGMRGILTIAAAMALPAGFPHRDFIQLTALVVVFGTLILQGLTLRPLLAMLNLPRDDIVETEIGVARGAALKAALGELDSEGSTAAERLRLEFGEGLSRTRAGGDPHDTERNALRQRVVPVARQAIHDLRRAGVIGDDAYRIVEEELDWLELSSQSHHEAEQAPPIS